MNKLYKWLLFNSLTASIVMYFALFYDAFGWLYKADITKVSFAILAVYILSSLYIAYGVVKGNINQKFLSFMAMNMMGIGLIGTCIASIFIFTSVLNISDAKEAVSHVLQGLATAPITTVFGLGGALLLSNQSAISTGDLDVT